MVPRSPRERLLDCAERLFAEHGVEGVSLRAINSEAGLSPAALHYHFGSKRALTEALLERQMPALMERRRQLLDALDDRPQPPTTREVLDALLRPQVELLMEGGAPGLAYLRLIHRLQADGDLDGRFVLDRWPGGVERLIPLLQRANPSLPVSLLQFRLGLAIAAMLRTLAEAPGAGAELEARVSALLDFLSGGFDAPITSRGKRKQER
jgi:AcrR family transcriptional regulator